MQTPNSYAYSCLLGLLFLAPQLECPPPSPTPSPKALSDITNTPSPAKKPASERAKLTEISELKEGDETPAMLTTRRNRRHAAHTFSPVPLYDPPSAAEEATSKLAADSGLTESTFSVEHESSTASLVHATPSTPPPPVAKPKRRIIAIQLLEPNVDETPSTTEPTSGCGACAGAGSSTVIRPIPLPGTLQQQTLNITIRRKIVQVQPLEGFDAHKLDEAPSASEPASGCGAGAGSSASTYLTPQERAKRLELNQYYYRGTVFGMREWGKFNRRINDHTKDVHSKNDILMFIELQKKNCFDLLKDFEERLMRVSPAGEAPDEKREYYWRGCKTGVIGSMEDAFKEGLFHSDFSVVSLEFLEQCDKELSYYAQQPNVVNRMDTDITHLYLAPKKAKEFNKNCMLYWTGYKCGLLTKIHKACQAKKLDLSLQGADDALKMYYEETFDRTLKYCKGIIAYYQEERVKASFDADRLTAQALVTYWQGFQEALCKLATAHRAVTAMLEKTVDNANNNALEVEAGKACEKTAPIRPAS